MGLEKTWLNCVEQDLVKIHVLIEDAQDLQRRELTNKRLTLTKTGKIKKNMYCNTLQTS